MAREHTATADADTPFEAGNYGTVTSSKVEWTFVVDPSTGLTSTGREEWPVDTKLRGGDRDGLCRRPKSMAEFSSEIAERNAKLVEQVSDSVNK